MKVTITLDNYDGSASKSKTVDLDGLSMSHIAFILMDANVAGVTITKNATIHKMIDKMEQST